MKLERMRLKNIRAFEDSGEIQFQDGTISIYGENGAGKSTIVSSIGRTLFGWEIEGIKQSVIDYAGERHKQGATQYLLRKGTAEGAIDVTFSHNGRVYRVVNTLSRKAQSWTLYVNGEKTDLHGKEEIHERIRDALGIPESHTSSAERLFSDVICVLQGRVVDEFEFTPQRRKDHFDKVLGLFSYRQAYSDSIHVNHNFKNKMARAESDARVLHAEIAHLTGLVKRLDADEKELNRLQRSLGVLQAKLQAAENEKQRYDALGAEIEHLKRELSTADSKADTLSTTLEAADREVQRSREARHTVEQHRPSFLRYKQLSGQLDEMKTFIRQVTRETARLSELRIAYASLASTKANKLEEMKRLDELSERVAELSPVAAEYTQLEETLSALKLDQQRYREVLQGISAAEDRIRSMQVTAANLETELAEYEALKAVADTGQTLSREHDELTRKIGELSGHDKQISDDIDNLLRGICPYTSEPCESIEARGRKYEEELGAIRAELTMLLSERDKRAEALNRAQQAASQVRVLDEKRREQERALADIGTLREDVEKERASLSELGRNLANLDSLEERISELTPAADEYRSLKYALDASDRAALLSELNELNGRAETLQHEITTTEAAIAHLIQQGGDEALASRLEAELRELQKNNDAYTAALSLAENLETATRRYNEYLQDSETLDSQRKRLAADITAKTRSYDEAEHQRSERDYAAISQRFNEMRGAASQLSRQIQDLQPQAADLTVKKEDLMALEVDLSEIAADGKFFEEIRESFKNLSAMRPLYTKKASQHAAQHWRQIINDGSQLHWQEDYLIFKTRGEDVISLYEMSGGEKISACLVVRLAVQEVLGGLGLFILDEPTAHLDEERCDSLARQIGSLKGLNQIIVISHDDTFHAHTQQQITVRKGANGRGSTVES